MKYIPYYELDGTPNIIVDGGANAATLLTLSHWPHSGTPWKLKRDLSAEIVFAYLEAPQFHIEAGAVSNNHFDEDGLISLYAMLNGERAQNKKNLLIDIAAAGDFGSCRFPDAARVAFTISAFANKTTSPLNAAIFQRSYPETTAALYLEMFERLPAILEHPETYREYWVKEEESLKQSEQAIASGRIRLEEVAGIDLAVITAPEKFQCHPMAINNTTNCLRILSMAGNRYEFKYRYETWVQFVSRPVVPRVDLAPLAEQFSQEDACLWIFDGVDSIVPSLAPEKESELQPEFVRRRIESFLAQAPPAWDPFDPRPS